MLIEWNMLTFSQSSRNENNKINLFESMVCGEYVFVHIMTCAFLLITQSFSIIFHKYKTLIDCIGIIIEWWIVSF